MGNELVKKCKACGELKLLSEFRLNRMMRDGHRSLCKPCSKENDRQYRVANPEKIRKNQRRFRVANPEKVRENDRRWRVANPEKRKENDRRYRIENPEKIKEKNRRFRVANPEKVREYRRLESKKRRSTLKGKLHNAISGAMNRSLKGNKNGRHWETLVGYTVDDLKKHLEKQFKPGMTWGNYGTAWEIDHKIPIAVHNFKHPEDIDFRLCWSLRNLQPLACSKNRSKSNKLSKPFQPSFAFAPTQTI
jgi:hypothetical protein